MGSVDWMEYFLKILRVHVELGYMDVSATARLHVPQKPEFLTNYDYFLYREKLDQLRDVLVRTVPILVSFSVDSFLLHGGWDGRLRLFDEMNAATALENTKTVLSFLLCQPHTIPGLHCTFTAEEQAILDDLGVIRRRLQDTFQRWIEPVVYLHCIWLDNIPDLPHPIFAHPLPPFIEDTTRNPRLSWNARHQRWIESGVYLHRIEIGNIPDIPDIPDTIFTHPLPLFIENATPPSHFIPSFSFGGRQTEAIDALRPRVIAEQTGWIPNRGDLSPPPSAVTAGATPPSISIARLSAILDELKKATCTICYDREPTDVLWCFHIFCAECSSRLGELCAVCRAPRRVLFTVTGARPDQSDPLAEEKEGERA